MGQRTVLSRAKLHTVTSLSRKAANAQLTQMLRCGSEAGDAADADPAAASAPFEANQRGLTSLPDPAELCKGGLRESAATK